MSLYSLEDVLTERQKRRLGQVIDMAYDYLEGKAAPKRAKAQHKLTSVDLKEVELALVELSELRRGNIWGIEGKHIESILEMLWAYGIADAQEMLPIGDA